MIIDMKYHIASLVAVFLALAMGILIGTTFLGNDAIIRQLEIRADSLAKDLGALGQENKELKVKAAGIEKSTRDYQEFGRSVLPQLVYNRLVGKQVALVETGNYGFNQDVIKSLQLAGGKIQSTTTILDGFDLSDQARKQQVINYLNLKESKTEDVMAALARLVAQGVVVGDNLATLNYLEQQKIIKKSGEYGVPINTIIIIGGSKDDSSAMVQVVDIPMIKYFLDKGMGVYGVEHRDVPRSYTKEYQQFKVTTVDNIETVPGQVALIWAMQGKPGNYGVKETAKELLPR
ncbi:MAG: copper transporter [Clostridia bacterium]|nr:copper transporter [Clostridia bacterium]